MLTENNEEVEKTIRTIQEVDNEVKNGADDKDESKEDDESNFREKNVHVIQLFLTEKKIIIKCK